MSGAARAESSRHRFSGLPADLALAGVVALVVSAGVWAELAAWPEPHSGVASAFPAGAVLIGLAASGALVVRRRSPLLCTVAVFVLVVGYHVAGYPGGAPALALFVALYSLAAWAESVWRIVLALVLVPVWAVFPALPPNAQPWDSFATLGPAIGMIWLVALGIAARGVRMTNRRSIGIAEAEAEARLRGRLAEERLAIARELHDVLAHTVSVITVQSGAAIDAFDDDPAAAKEAMVRVRALATAALPELRRTLGALRSAAGASAEPTGPETFAPQPGLGDLPGLVGAARSPGLEVVLEDSADHELVGAMLATTVYRIVQESLTNVIRHSGASSAVVSLSAERGCLRVRISDNGNRGGPQSAAAGFGIQGMRERARALGGRFSAGRGSDAGYVVTAEFPGGQERL